MDYKERMQSISEHYNQAILAFRKDDYTSAIPEFRRVLELNPPPDMEIITCFNCAMSLWNRRKFWQRDPGSISTQEHEELKEAQQLLGRVIEKYENLSESVIRASNFPLREIYNEAKKYWNMFITYGLKYYAKKDMRW